MSVKEQLVALLRGEAHPPGDGDADLWLRVAEDEGVVGLLEERVRAHECRLSALLRQRCRELALGEELQRRELRRVLAGLSAAGIDTVVFKGTALAQLVYPRSYLRGRCDTDLFVRERDRAGVNRILDDMGYDAPAQAPAELFHQWVRSRELSPGVDLVLDLHWKLSCRRRFADVLTLEELLEKSVPVPSLGETARAPGWPHALLISCLHPAMHHGNDDRLIWQEDLRRISSHLSPAGRKAFRGLAHQKEIAEICRSALSRAGVPQWDLRPTRWRDTGAATRAYLRTGRRWWQDIVDDWCQSTWRERGKMAGFMLFPPISYLRARYPIRASWMIPPTYLRRIASGVPKLFRKLQ